MESHPNCVRERFDSPQPHSHGSPNCWEGRYLRMVLQPSFSLATAALNSTELKKSIICESTSSDREVMHIYLLTTEDTSVPSL